MIYVDTSVVLAQLLAEDRVPPGSLWTEQLVTSRLTEYEVWVRLHARGLVESHGDGARGLLGRFAMLEMTPVVLVRALEPFPVSVRTLDALHLASAHFLNSRDRNLELASYDSRMLDAARALGLSIRALE